MPGRRVLLSPCGYSLHLLQQLSSAQSPALSPVAISCNYHLPKMSIYEASASYANPTG